MDRVIEPLDCPEIEAFLNRQVVGRIGCHVDGRTYVVQVIYAWDGGCIHVLSIEGRKIEMMRANPNVCFEVDEYRSGGGWRSVIVEGVFEELDGEAAGAAVALLVRRFAGSRTRGGRRSERAPVAFRIRPETVSGRRVGGIARTRGLPRVLAAVLRRRRS